jgi:phosphoketolase
MTGPADDELRRIDAWWRAANYLAVGQIYLLDNPLLREPLTLEHVKPRLLGHWGTSPGLTFTYAHLNRAIRAHDLDAMYVTGPGHGGPAIVACAWLEGTYGEVYPEIGRDEEGMRRLFRQFSFPGGSSGTPWPTPTGPPSTTPTCSCAASSATARPRPDRSRRAGTPPASSTPSTTARCCRCCT